MIRGYEYVSTAAEEWVLGLQYGSMRIVWSTESCISRSYSLRWVAFIAITTPYMRRK